MEFLAAADRTNEGKVQADHCLNENLHFRPMREPHTCGIRDRAASGTHCNDGKLAPSGQDGSVVGIALFDMFLFVWKIRRGELALVVIPGWRGDVRSKE